MSSLFPGATPNAGSASPSDTLAAAGHTALHNTHSDDARALASKIGTGSSTPTSAKLLRGTGVGTSAWAQADLTQDVTGVLPQANGGTGTTLATGTGKAVYDTVPTISAPVITGQPTISDFTNANHSHANAAGGGTLNAANALQTGTVTPYTLANSIIQGVVGGSVNPIPTSIVDMPSSSVTFSLTTACFMIITYSCTIQINGQASANQAEVRLNVDGSDVATLQDALFGHQSGGASEPTVQFTTSRTVKVALASGSHTIKLRTVANTLNASVAYTPQWWGILVSQ